MEILTTLSAETAEAPVLSPYFTLLRCPAAWANEAHPSGQESCWRTELLINGLGLLLQTPVAFSKELGVWGWCALGFLDGLHSLLTSSGVWNDSV